MRFFRSIFVAVTMILLAAPGASLRACGVFGNDDSANFVADVYPSPGSALDAFARQIAATLKSSKSFDADTAKITIVGDPTGSIGDALRLEFPKAEIATAATTFKPTERNAFVVRITLAEVKRPGAVWGSTDLESGTLNASFIGADKFAPVATKFVDKPWADDWTAFVNRDPKKKWVLAESPRPCISEREADEQARQAAALALWPAVREQMRIYATNRTKIWVTQEFVVEQISASLARDIGVADQFVQRFDRPYGRLWKKSLLIDASKPTIDALTRNISVVARADRAEKVGTWASTGLLVAVIILLYFFVNAVTKGYFVWRLRAVALLLAIVGIITVLALR